MNYILSSIVCSVGNEIHLTCKQKLVKKKKKWRAANCNNMTTVILQLNVSFTQNRLQPILILNALQL